LETVATFFLILPPSSYYRVPHLYLTAYLLAIAVLSFFLLLSDPNLDFFRRFKRAVWAIVAVGLLTKKMLLNRMVSRILYRSPYPVSPAAYLPDNFDRAAATLFTGCCNFLPQNEVRSSPCAQKVLVEVPTNGNRMAKLGSA
jgi:hypothetical protein